MRGHFKEEHLAVQQFCVLVCLTNAVLFGTPSYILYKSRNANIRLTLLLSGRETSVYFCRGTNYYS